MSVISALFDNKVYNFEQAFGVKDITSSGMRAAITDWYGLYYNNEPNDKENPCQRLPVAIVSKLYGLWNCKRGSHYGTVLPDRPDRQGDRH